MTSTASLSCDELFTHTAYLPSENPLVGIKQVQQKNIHGQIIQETQNEDVVRFISFDNGTAAQGKLSASFMDHNGEVAYLSFSSESQLLGKNNKNKWNTLAGQGFEQHAHGFGMPVGSPFEQSVNKLKIKDWNKLGVYEGEQVILNYPSGVIVTGKLDKFELNEAGEVVVLKFVDGSAEVKFGEQVLFDPSWGTYDLLVGEKISNSMPMP